MKKNSKIFLFLGDKSGLRPGNTAFLRFYVYQNDVRSDPFDAIPGDQEVIPPPPKAEKAASSRHDNGGDPPLRQLDPGIGDKAQPQPVPNANDLLAVQIRKPGNTQPPKQFW